LFKNVKCKVDKEEGRGHIRSPLPKTHSNFPKIKKMPLDLGPNMESSPIT